MIKKIANQNPHNFRHAFATHLYKNKEGIKIIQELLGHENMNTTGRYIEILATEKRKAVNKL